MISNYSIVMHWRVTDPLQEMCIYVRIYDLYAIDVYLNIPDSDLLTEDAQNRNMKHKSLLKF